MECSHALSEIETLYPFRHKIIQVKVRDAWLLHAERHAHKICERKNKISISPWDIAQRLGEIAFGVKYKLIEEYPIEGKRNPPFKFVTTRVSIHSSPYDDKYSNAEDMSLKVFKEWIKAKVHILAVYDPPFIDLVGWCTLSELMDAAEYRGRTNLPANQLHSMIELREFVNK